MAQWLILQDYSSATLGVIEAGTVQDDEQVAVPSSVARIPYVASLHDPLVAAFKVQRGVLGSYRVSDLAAWLANLETDSESGTYAATLTDVTNVDASTFVSAHYTVSGSIVTVHFAVTVDATAAAATELGISLPVASNLGAATDLTGFAVSDTAGENGALVEADAANDRASLQFTAVDIAAANGWRGSFSYEVI